MSQLLKMGNVVRENFIQWWKIAPHQHAIRNCTILHKNWIFHWVAWFFEIFSYNIFLLITLESRKFSVIDIKKRREEDVSWMVRQDWKVQQKEISSTHTSMTVSSFRAALCWASCNKEHKWKQFPSMYHQSVIVMIELKIDFLFRTSFILKEGRGFDSKVSDEI